MTFSNRRQRFVGLLATSATLFLTSALVASAQLSPDYGLKATANAAGLPTGQPDPTAVVSSIINILLSVVGVLAIVLIIYAGALWMTSQGNEEKISQAKKLLAGSVVGLLIIFAAYAIAFFIVSQLSKATGANQQGLQPGQVQPLAQPGTCAYYVGTQCVPTASCAGVSYPASDCGTGICCSQAGIRTCGGVSGYCYDASGGCTDSVRPNNRGQMIGCTSGFICCSS